MPSTITLTAHVDLPYIVDLGGGVVTPDVIEHAVRRLQEVVADAARAAYEHGVILTISDTTVERNDG